ncbi:MAG TPA: cytochrome c [Marinagarivorans sp.]
MPSFICAARLIASLGLAAALSGCVGPGDTDTPSSELNTTSSSITAVQSSSVTLSSSAPVASSSAPVIVSSASLAESSSSSVESSSQATLSSSSEANANVPNLVAGQAFYKSTEIYALSCETCHGPDGNGSNPIELLIPARTTQDGLAQYITDSMPKNSAGNCVDDCARDTAAYILNGYSTTVDGQSSSTSVSASNSSSSTPTIGDVENAVSEEIRIERVAKGQTFFQAAANTCVVCHGANGEGGIGGSLENCDVCDTWEGLKTYIEVAMPDGGTAEGGASPEDCVGECAEAITDWIWNSVNGWALTSVGGVAGGVKVVTENRYGQDTLRLKTYSMLEADFTRIFGDVPSVFAGSASAFKPEPEFWHTDGEIGAVSLNVLVNSALQGCANENLPALTEPALRSSCADWATRMWLRPATEEELQSCVDVALIDAAELNNAEEQAKYACVSMMISLPAITY